jgi:ribosome-binding factor A
MCQKKNKKQLLLLLNSVKGSSQSLKSITSEWIINPDLHFVHDTELSGKVTSGKTISVNDYYPLIDYTNGDKLVTKSQAKA